MDVREHPAHNVPTATEHYDGDRPYNYEQGVRSLKKEMADVFDASGQNYPDSPHYSETQDKVSSSDFRK